MDVKRRVKATYLTFLPLYIFSSFFIKMKGLANRPQKCKKGVQKNVQAPPLHCTSLCTFFLQKNVSSKVMCNVSTKRSKVKLMLIKIIRQYNVSNVCNAD